MGGSKNKSPAQKERAQKRNTDQKTKSFLQKLVKDGIIKKVAGFSGHYIYHSVSK